MSAAKTVLTLAAAVVVFPVAMRAREGAAARAALSVPTVTEESAQATAADVRAYLNGIRGANAVQCEIVLSTYNSWSSNRSPDRDSVAWNIGMVVHRRITVPELIPELMTAMRSDDDCLSRAATRLLGRSRLPQARSELLAALRDENARVRTLAAIGIGFSDDSTATGPLVRALADRDERVRAAVAWALGAVN